MTYLAISILIITFVAVGYEPPKDITSSASAVDYTDDSETSNISIDDVSATVVAASVAEVADLPVAANVANLSQTIATESKMAQSENETAAKPQIVKLGEDSRDITTHTVTKGENVQTIAAQYGISAQTIRWVNNLETDAVSVGTKLSILPVDGMYYTVQDGDTVEKIASKYKVSPTELVTYNDLESSGVSKGQKLIVPGGVLPESERPGYQAPEKETVYAGSGDYSGGSASSNNLKASVGNRYAAGNCTWYVYERRAQLGRPVGSFWGNASSWAYNAAAAGYTVNGTPTIGAVMQNSGGYYGHVAIVESVNPGVSITISEMNARRFGGGYNRIGTGQISWNEAVSGAYRYIQ